jgi:hypothetical protein
MLIDVSYFTAGPRHILNASLGTMPNPNAEEVNAAIEDYIAYYQEQYLCEMLGESLGNKVNAYLVCQDEGDTISNEHIETLCAQLRQSFADYVYYQIIGTSNEQATMTGLVMLKSANTYSAPINRQVGVWNAMVERNRRFAQWCNSSECSFPNIRTSSNMLTKINNLNL